VAGDQPGEDVLLERPHLAGVPEEVGLVHVQGRDQRVQGLGPVAPLEPPVEGGGVLGARLLDRPPDRSLQVGLAGRGNGHPGPLADQRPEAGELLVPEGGPR
jgi:hypothetical protein